MKYLLDTHTWIWWNARPAALSPKVKSLLNHADRYDELLLSAISVWEFCKMLEAGEAALSCAPEDWIATALDMPKFRVVPLTPGISYRSTTLPDGFSGDAADQIIVATAREENATILTRDDAMAAYKHVQTLW